MEKQEPLNTFNQNMMTNLLNLKEKLNKEEQESINFSKNIINCMCVQVYAVKIHALSILDVLSNVVLLFIYVLHYVVFLHAHIINALNSVGVQLVVVVNVILGENMFVLHFVVLQVVIYIFVVLIVTAINADVTYVLIQDVFNH